jgi:hypothetical protein
MQNPTPKSPERAFALQKYLLLHSQHDALQKHLDQITSIPPASLTTVHTSSSVSPRLRHSSLSSLSTSPDNDSVSSSDYLTSTPPQPMSHHHHRSSSTIRPSRPPMIKRRSSLPTVIDESILEVIEEDETKLKDVNQQIKGTLTELLNCESVRADKRYRMWVQSRLMDAERELTRARKGSCSRRRSVDIGALRL